jgi:hypothetical protein
MCCAIPILACDDRMTLPAEDAANQDQAAAGPASAFAAAPEPSLAQGSADAGAAAPSLTVAGPAAAPNLAPGTASPLAAPVGAPSAAAASAPQASIAAVGAAQGSGSQQAATAHSGNLQPVGGNVTMLTKPVAANETAQGRAIGNLVATSIQLGADLAVSGRAVSLAADERVRPPGSGHHADGHLGMPASPCNAGPRLWQQNTQGPQRGPLPRSECAGMPVEPSARRNAESLC